jgi:hypothetical protein
VTNPTVEAPQIFDPAIQQKNPDSNWLIDFSQSGIDAEGWTYASDFNYLNTKGAGEAGAKWNSYVRRRKWKYVEKGGSVASEGLQGVRERAAARTVTAAAGNGSGGATGTVEKLGYVPRQRMPAINATGLTSSSMAGTSKAKDQELDSEAQAGMNRLKQKDAAIDAGIDIIANSLDNLNKIAGGMKEEVHSQAAKTERLENSMQKASEKQAIVNARQKKLVASS